MIKDVVIQPFLKVSILADIFIMLVESIFAIHVFVIIE